MRSSGTEVGDSSKIVEEDGQVDLGLKLLNQHRPFMCNQRDSINLRKPSNGCDNDDDDGDGGGGPTSCNGYTTNTMLSDVYYNVSVTAVDGSPSVVRPLQPFDVNSYSTAYNLFKHSGGMATAAIGYPFTVAQWKELERQAMIYKYMVSSLPVPPHLLYSSFPANLSTATAYAPTPYLLGKYGNGMNFRWVGNNKDAEPGRCRRTDGKKWRCSRDVAPNQKYCERHMHRGRPRSRKPVELTHNHPHHSLSDFPINKSNSGNDSNKNNTSKKAHLTGATPNPQSVASSLPSVLPSKTSAFHNPMVPGVNPFEDSRSLCWTEEQQWQQLMQANMNTQLFGQQFEGEALNLNSHVGFNAKSDVGLFERPLIDAWSMGMNESKSHYGSNKASFSSPNGNTMDEDMCQIHMGLGVNDPWLSCPPSAGGPLAEVLRPSSVAATASRLTSDSATSDGGEGDFITCPATTVSSPSGVLQKALASFSDSSGSSSPTCHNSQAKSDMPFHWLN